MNNVQRDRSIDRSNPHFWKWHPIGRGIGAGVIADIFTKATLFRTGFIYGGVSGLANIALRPTFKRIKENEAQTCAPPTKKAYLYSKIIPWAVSVGFMHTAYKLTGFTPLRIKPSVAVGIALGVEYFAFANLDLLPGNGRD